MRGYKAMRIPKEVYENIKSKRTLLQKLASDITGKNISIPYTRVIRILSNQTINMGDKELIRSLKK